jgi:hypothetical protein
MEHQENTNIQPSELEGPPEDTQLAADATDLVVEETEYIPALVQDT